MQVLVPANFSRILLDCVREILYFPLWWYSRGIKKYWAWAWSKIKRVEDILAFSVMLQNIYRPLYGDYSVIGILIGPVIRLFWFSLIGSALLCVLLFFLGLFGLYLGFLPLSFVLLFRLF